MVISSTSAMLYSLNWTCRVSRLKREPPQTSQGTYTSGRNCISILFWPWPWQASQRPPLDIEGETPGLVAPDLAFRQFGEQARGYGRTARYRCRVGARGAADGGLVDVDDFIEVLQPFDAVVVAGDESRRGSSCWARDLYRISFIRDGLAGARDAGDAHQFAQRDLDIDILEVVLACATDQ